MPLQARAQALAQTGKQVKKLVGSFEPFLQRAQTEAQLASGLGTTALGQLGTASATLGGVPLGAHSFSTRRINNLCLRINQQVIDASLAEFDRNKQIQEQQLRDQQAKLGVLGAVVERECNSQSLAQGLRENVRYYKPVSCNKVFNQAQAS